MNSNINSSGLYDVNSYNLITTNATVLSTLNVAGNIIGSGTALTNLNYDSITNKPSLTLFNNPITCVLQWHSFPGTTVRRCSRCVGW